MTDTKPLTGFDPSIVVKFFEAISGIVQRLDSLSLEVRELRKDLAEGGKIFVLHTEQLRRAEDWQKAKDADCRQHQEQTRELAAQAREIAATNAVVQELRETVKDLRDEIRDFKAQATGVGRLWKFLIAIAAGMSTVIGLVTALKVLH